MYMDMELHVPRRNKRRVRGERKRVEGGVRGKEEKEEGWRMGGRGWLQVPKLCNFAWL
jgi:hypothetical protein